MSNTACGVQDASLPPAAFMRIESRLDVVRIVELDVLASG
jgi:hypothetical protein